MAIGRDAGFGRTSEKHQHIHASAVKDMTADVLVLVVKFGLIEVTCSLRVPEEDA